MSSDDASDDSGFDKEAEREKLREKYEEDREGRENTRRMSELLLQGATMTGKHCDNCGDPIFRYDGQEFCPTCQHEAQQAQSAAEEGAVTDRTDAESTEQTAADQSEAEESKVDGSEVEKSKIDESETEGSETGETTANESASGEPRVEIDGIRVADQQPSTNTETASRHADSSNLRQPPSQQGGRDQGRRESVERRDSSRAGGRRRARTRDHDARKRGHARARDASDHDHGAGDSEGDLATARESLVRKLTDLALRAEETDDVARTRELLAATREAAEALDALDRANR